MFPAISSSSTLIADDRQFYNDDLSHLLLKHQEIQYLDPKNINMKKKKKRSQPDPEAEVIALSPRTLMATNRFVCEICNKGFQRDQNLQLHRRGHNLPWKLSRRKIVVGDIFSSPSPARKKVYVCPEKSCVHHDPSRALGDLTGVKKHFCRKHGEKKWKCEKCSKRYAVQSDWKAHSKTCGTKEYTCDCGSKFARKDSFVNHRAFCEALAQESARLFAISGTVVNPFTTSWISQIVNPNPRNHVSHLTHLHGPEAYDCNPRVMVEGFNGGDGQFVEMASWMTDACQSGQTRDFLGGGAGRPTSGSRRRPLPPTDVLL